METRYSIDQLLGPRRERPAAELQPVAARAPVARVERSLERVERPGPRTPEQARQTPATCADDERSMLPADRTAGGQAP